MPQRPFRFLHAADLHLDAPCRTADEVPDYLVDQLIDAPLHAATKVFDAALNQHVDFVVLAGNVIDPHHCAPRELLFLAEQLQRLADRNISVYWSGGPIDSAEHWPAYISWPKNIYRFPAGRTERLRHEISGIPVCEIVGSGHAPLEPPKPYQFAPSGENLFSIALAHADWNAGALGEIAINYWALGGPHHRSTPLEAARVAHFAGSPQGRTPHETGPHGCTIATVDEQAHLQLTPIACDALRWLTPKISLPETAGQHDLERLLHQRTEKLLAESSSLLLFTTWHVACQGELRFALRHGSLAADLVSKLRADFGHQPSPVWTLGLEAELPDQFPAEWLTEETLRGDFLRSVQLGSPDHSSTAPVPVSINNNPDTLDSTVTSPQPLLLPFPEQLSDIAALANIPSAAIAEISSLSHTHSHFSSCRKTWHEVAWLGAELLSPAEAKQ